MTRLVALPGRIRGQANAGPVQWINPERIVTIRPKISETDTFDLTIELKLDGVPLFETWFGSYPTIDAADARWQAFLHELHPNHRPPKPSSLRTPPQPADLLDATSPHHPQVVSATPTSPASPDHQSIIR